MALISWNDSYSVGIKVIDEQHKYLFELLDQLIEAESENRGKEILENILEDLIKYCNSHFILEEKLMIENNYPYFSSHKRSHDQFSSKINLLLHNFKMGETGLVQETVTFVLTWLIEHIQGTDTLYVPYLLKK